MMSVSTPKHAEINERTMKLIVGLIAIVIASATSMVSTLGEPLTSISESYFAGDWSRNIFVGFLFAISAFLLSYNGQTAVHKVLSRVAAVAGVGVAMFPCKCRGDLEIIPYVHYVSAAVMFVILAYFCMEFYRHAKGKGHPQAHVRALIYLACFWAMVVSMVLLLVNGIWGADLGWNVSAPRLVFYGEATALLAFGICWLVASRVLPVLTRPDERHHLIGEDVESSIEPKA